MEWKQLEAGSGCGAAGVWCGCAASPCPCAGFGCRMMAAVHLHWRQRREACKVPLPALLPLHTTQPLKHQDCSQHSLWTPRTQHSFVPAATEDLGFFFHVSRSGNEHESSRFRMRGGRSHLQGTHRVPTSCPLHYPIPDTCCSFFFCKSPKAAAFGGFTEEKGAGHRASLSEQLYAGTFGAVQGTRSDLWPPGRSWV